MSNEINKIIEIIETNKVTETETDPFDEALDDNYKSVFIDISTGKLFTTSILPHLVSEMQVVILRLSLLLLFHYHLRIIIGYFDDL